jgi:Asp/Glu/hydantoin racemase
MRILMINPNTTDAMTQRMLAAGQHAAASATELVAVTAARGVPYIATRAEAQIGGAIVLEMLAENRTGWDAAIIAAFGDPGLLAARELFSLPVIGVSEAAMLTACMLGRTFSIVTFSRTFGPWYRECVEMHGLTSRLASIRMADRAFRSVVDVQEEHQDLLVSAANRAVAEDGADVVIFGGGPLAGLADKVKDRIDVPVVDPLAAAVKQAEALHALKVRKAIKGAFRRPDPKAAIGLADALTRHLEHKDDFF